MGLNPEHKDERPTEMLKSNQSPSFKDYIDKLRSVQLEREAHI